MKLPQPSSARGGFSLLEVILATGILAVILALGMPIWGFYQRYQLNSEQQLLQTILRQARNFSMINHNESRHGLYINQNNFILFQGDSYAGRNPAQDRIFPRAGGIAISGPVEIVFESLSGRTASSTFSVNNNEAGKNIYVNSEGAIQ